MSLLAVQGGATGTGTVSLVAPVTNTNRTLTLPDATGTVLSSATTTGFPAGSVLQVVQVVASTQQISTSNTYADMTGMSVSITPTSASSKILAIVNVNGAYAGQALTGMQTRLVRGATSIAFGGAYAAYQAASGDQDVGSVVMQILDSPATTSATTYKVQFRSRTGGNEVRVNLNDSPGGNTQLNDASTNSVITLMEIAA